MALKRVLEPELMETDRDAREYGKIDHAAAEMEFVRVLSEELGFARGGLIDLGAGPCGIPVEICRRIKGARVTAVEMALPMLKLASGRIARSGFSGCIRLVRADAKATGLPPRSFDFAVCNNLAHHIADPRLLFREIARLLRPGGGVLIRDLRRPRTARELADRMGHCCGDTPRQRELLRGSLLAALLPEEAAAFARKAGLKGLSLRVEGDRHWELRRAVE
ncbi:MAG TPA: class I SAM-dependent methyltransferase [Elusimicrobia bacterium]|nr:MAG: hypothetical protein A2016_08920 [Elusimicrobia bacterium GWF2_62_30]HBA61960.1 class I SAM-dependent methyltransferase [Elusimicrobiota bacterium]